MSDMEGRAIETLPRGQKAGMGLTLYGGRVMPQTFGQVVEYAQMMCKGGLAIPKHLRENPGTCLRVIQQAMAWEMDPWAVASKTYAVNDILAYEAQLISAVIRKWAPIKERVIPYKFSGAGDELRCTITLHHAETGEEIFYQSPKLRDITPKNSPLWKADTEQQLSYYTIRALTRRHFPELLLGVYDREEVLAMRDITPAEPQKVDNYLEDEVPPKDIREGEVLPPIAAEPVPDASDVPITPDLIATNLEKAIAGHTDKIMLEKWQGDNHKEINALPPDLARRVRKTLTDRYLDLEEY